MREKERQLDERMPDWYRRMATFAAELEPGLGRIEAGAERLTEVPFTAGNRVDLLVDAEATYGAMLDAIGAAESYVLVQFYIVRDDRSGRSLRDAPIERARYGVRVCFLYDEIGSIKLRASYLDEMRRASIQVSGFRTTQGLRNRFQINSRNHRKLLVVDGRTGFIGGLNLGDEYLGFRDTHLRIEGPAAQQIQLTFRKDWHWATREIIDIADQPIVAAEPGQAVGTVNLDYRSLYLNFEETAVVADAQFARSVEAMLEDDLMQCDEVSPGHLEGEPLHIRVQARVARLASPLL